MMRVQELLRLPRGKPRRQVMDDVTVGVLIFGDQSASGVADVSAGVPGDNGMDNGTKFDEESSVVCDLIDRTRKHPESNFFF